MSIETECPDCGKVYRVKDEMAGKRFRCKQCQSAVTIPSAASVRESMGTPPEPTPERSARSHNSQPTAGDDSNTHDHTPLTEGASPTSRPDEVSSSSLSEGSLPSTSQSSSKGLSVLMLLGAVIVIAVVLMIVKVFIISDSGESTPGQTGIFPWSSDVAAITTTDEDKVHSVIADVR